MNLKPGEWYWLMLSHALSFFGKVATIGGDGILLDHKVDTVYERDIGVIYRKRPTKLFLPESHIIYSESVDEAYIDGYLQYNNWFMPLLGKSVSVNNSQEGKLYEMLDGTAVLNPYIAQVRTPEGYQFILSDQPLFVPCDRKQHSLEPLSMSLEELLEQKNRDAQLDSMKRSVNIASIKKEYQELEKKSP